MRFKLNVQLELLPAASVAVSVTTVVPTPFKVVPGAGDWEILILAAVPQLSIFVANER